MNPLKNLLLQSTFPPRGIWVMPSRCCLSLSQASHQRLLSPSNSCYAQHLCRTYLWGFTTFLYGHLSGQGIQCPLHCLLSLWGKLFMMKLTLQKKPVCKGDTFLTLLMLVSYENRHHFISSTLTQRSSKRKERQSEKRHSYYKTRILLSAIPLYKFILYPVSIISLLVVISHSVPSLLICQKPFSSRMLTLFFYPAF